MKTLGYHKPLYIGFAVGRTSFWDALVDSRANKISREDAAKDIAGRYVQFVDIFQEQVRAA
jgi:myo-inositol catabolism protein IolC